MEPIKYPCHARQGDVLISARRDAPNTRIPASTPVAPDPKFPGRAVLAYGEVTGHCHSLPAEAAEIMVNDDNQRFLRMVGAAPVEHDEHASVMWPQHNAELIIQSEYSPEAIRNTAD